MLYHVHLAMSGIQAHNVSGDCIGSYKSNYHTITTTLAIKYMYLNLNDKGGKRLCFPGQKKTCKNSQKRRSFYILNLN